MLRTFCSNPALGGFGGESSSSSSWAPLDAGDATATPDAFCQIIKELVDNAVDACTIAAANTMTCSSTTTTTTTTAPTDDSSTKRIKHQNTQGKIKRATTATAPVTKRVRVVIERLADTHRSLRAAATFQGHNETNNEILRVTVSDNGCGMSDIQACVGAFHTSKAHHHHTHTTTNPRPSRAPHAASSNLRRGATEAQTAGRYGIGLTLCLLHAQRLVPDSCASLQSATGSDPEWTVVTAVVDTASDTVRCFPRESLAKATPTESGTAISVLVPVRSSADWLISFGLLARQNSF